MIKRFVIFVLSGCFALGVNAQKSKELLDRFALGVNATKGECVVRSFATNMQLWVQTSKLEYQRNLQRLCDGKKKIRVADEIVGDLATKNGYPGVKGAYLLETYLNCLLKEIKKGITIQYSNYRTISAFETTTSDTRGLNLIACDVVVSGAVNYKVKDLFYVRDGKISKIDKYEETIDRRTGRRKVKVDFSDIDFADEAYSLTYNYSKSFPVGLSFDYAWPWFRLGLDFGIDFKKDQYVIDDVNFTDIMNYDRTKKTLDPKCYITVTPSLYFRYFSIGCGVGALFMTGTEEHCYSSYASSGGTSVSGSSSLHSDCSKLNVMLRPVAKGYIPVSDEGLDVVVSVGYDYVFGYKEKNGLNFGVGIQFVLD